MSLTMSDVAAMRQRVLAGEDIPVAVLEQHLAVLRANRTAVTSSKPKRATPSEGKKTAEELMNQLMADNL